MPQLDYSQEQYSNDFLSDQEKAGKALEHALDIRKFEIELYWTRATYFWAFIGATFAGFLAIQASEVDNRQDLSVILSCLGLVFSVAWLCVVVVTVSVIGCLTFFWLGRTYPGGYWHRATIRTTKIKNG